GRALARDPALRRHLPVDIGVGARGGRVRRGADDLRNARLLAVGPAPRGTPGARCRDLPDRVRTQVAAAAGRVPGGAPGRHPERGVWPVGDLDRKSTRLNSSHEWISYAVFCLKKKKNNETKYAKKVADRTARCSIQK